MDPPIAILERMHEYETGPRGCGCTNCIDLFPLDARGHAHPPISDGTSSGLGQTNSTTSTLLGPVLAIFSPCSEFATTRPLGRAFTFMLDTLFASLISV